MTPSIGITKGYIIHEYRGELWPGSLHRYHHCRHRLQALPSSSSSSSSSGGGRGRQGGRGGGRLHLQPLDGARYELQNLPPPGPEQLALDLLADIEPSDVVDAPRHVVAVLDLLLAQQGVKFGLRVDAVVGAVDEAAPGADRRHAQEAHGHLGVVVDGLGVENVAAEEASGVEQGALAGRQARQHGVVQTDLVPPVSSVVGTTTVHDEAVLD